MTNPAIIEAALRAMQYRATITDIKAVLSAVTPLIEAAALERAAQMAEARKDALSWNNHAGKLAAKEIAASIRALIEEKK